VADESTSNLDPVMGPGDLSNQVLESLDPDVVGVEPEDPSDLTRGDEAEVAS
jgi:hypothetical protein